MWEAAGCPQTGNRPKEGEILGYTNTGHAILRYSDTIPLPNTQGDVEALALYAGQSTGLVNNLNTSSQIIAQLVNEVEVAYKFLKKVL